jgi:hypothetical protein
VHREVKQVRALAVALAQLGLMPPLSVHLSRAAAGPEVFVRGDTALGLDDLIAHPLPPEMPFVIRAFEGAPTTVQVFSVRYSTSLGVP